MLQYLTGNEDRYRCVEGVLGWCFDISQGKKIIINACMVYLHGASISHIVRRSLYMRLGWCFNISQGKNIIVDAFRVYLNGALKSHRVRRSL